MKITDLKRNLNKLTKQELIKEIAELYKKNSFVKDYCIAKYADKNDETILNKQKKIIENEFFPARGYGKGRLSVAKKAVTDFGKLSKNCEQKADIMLSYVEAGVRFTNAYGDIDETFYYSMEAMYQKAVEFIVANDLVKAFNKRCFEIVEDSRDIGWGFYDGLAETYHDYIGE